MLRLQSFNESRAQQKQESRTRSTHSTKRRDLLRKAAPNIVWDALEVEDKLWEDSSVVLLPLPNNLEILSRAGLSLGLTGYILSLSYEHHLPL